MGNILKTEQKELDWKQEWKEMPEFIQEKKEPYSKIIVRFENEEDLQEFAKLIGQKLTNKTKSIWHPFKSHWGLVRETWIGLMKNKYPIYVISKGRPNSCITARELKLMGVKFTLVVEPQEFDSYLDIKEVERFHFDSKYGTTYVVKYLTTDDKMLKYMGSSPAEISKEQFQTVKATVKHSEYNSQLETKLQRIKVI